MKPTTTPTKNIQNQGPVLKNKNLADNKTPTKPFKGSPRSSMSKEV